MVLITRNTPSQQKIVLVSRALLVLCLSYYYISSISSALTTLLTTQLGGKEGRHNSSSYLPILSNEKVDTSYLLNGEEVYFKAAKSFTPTTDKVTTHSYQSMYGQFLLPYYYQHPKMKLLEIGLGCDMNYEPGASVQLYQKLFPHAELWEAEYDAECVRKSKEHGMLDGINTVTGDQMDITTLERWIQESGGNFDIVIDDGGHEMCQIWTSFLKLWPQVKSGGLYFIEDLQISKNAQYQGNLASPLCDIDTVVPENLKVMINDLIYIDEKNHYPFSSEVKMITCQREACVLQKK